MKLAISNIGWPAEMDSEIYQKMKMYGFTGLEIAPTRIFPDHPYDDLNKAGRWYQKINKEYGFVIPSIQSVCFGRQENIFKNEKERSTLMSYLKKAVDFACKIHCRNLVFGCPKNRNIPAGKSKEYADVFFREIGDYAFDKGVVIGMEANPPVYHTNFINRTTEALALIDRVESRGFLLNLDIGTMIQNNETAEILDKKVRYISHVHISEAGLVPIQERNLHRKIAERLLEGGYKGFVSMEMSRQDRIDVIEKSMLYVKEIFG